MLGIGTQSAVFTIIIVLIGTSSFYATFKNRINTIELIIFIISATISLLNLIVAHMTDPGYVPRGAYRYSSIVQQKTKLKYCRTCCIWRGPRTKHCKNCDACVDLFDHHCPWIGNCVAKRNYHNFLRFTTSLSFFVIISLFIILREIAKTFQMGEDFADNIIEVCCLLYYLFFAPFIITITIFHCFLMAKGTTTEEYLTDKLDPSNNNFDNGIFRNIIDGYFPCKIAQSNIIFKGAQNSSEQTYGFSKHKNSFCRTASIMNLSSELEFSAVLTKTDSFTSSFMAATRNSMTKKWNEWKSQNMKPEPSPRKLTCFASLCGLT